METKTKEKKEIKLRLWAEITFWIVASIIVLTNVISIVIKYFQIHN